MLRKFNTTLKLINTFYALLTVISVHCVSLLELVLSLGLLYRVNVGTVTDVSEFKAACIYRVKVIACSNSEDVEELVSSKRWQHCPYPFFLRLLCDETDRGPRNTSVMINGIQVAVRAEHNFETLLHENSSFCVPELKHADR
jgi:hypothetical protein